MTKGRKALLRVVPDYCARYHCPGDCGQPHNQDERIAHARSVLDAFDQMEREAGKQARESAAIVRAKARKSL
jgi:hypothetical protein